MPDQFPALAKELAALQPNVLLSESTPAAAALKQETNSIPIVFVGVSNPVGSGFVTNLARPGGNLTGMMQYESGIVGKWLLVANPKFRGYDYFLRFYRLTSVIGSLSTSGTTSFIQSTYEDIRV
jgi:hypothetical protein